MASGSGSIANRIVIDKDDGTAYCPECGAILQDERSNKHLGMFMAFLKHVVDEWPKFAPDGKPMKWTPDNREHLRAIALMKVKHCEPEHLVDWETPEQREYAIKLIERQMAADRAMGRYGIVTIFDDHLVVKRPASIAMHGPKKISEKKFCQITEKVFGLIAKETGIILDEWKKSGRRK